MKQVKTMGTTFSCAVALEGEKSYGVHLSPWAFLDVLCMTPNNYEVAAVVAAVVYCILLPNTSAFCYTVYTTIIKSMTHYQIGLQIQVHLH